MSETNPARVDAYKFGDRGVGDRGVGDRGVGDRGVGGVTTFLCTRATARA